MAAAAVIAAPVAAGPEAQVAPVVPAEGGAPFEGRRRGRGGPPRPRSPSLEDYQLVERQRSQTPEDEIRVAGAGRVTKYVAYAIVPWKDYVNTTAGTTNFLNIRIIHFSNAVRKRTGCIDNAFSWYVPFISC